MAGLREIDTSIKSQMPAAAGLSSKAVQNLPTTGPGEEDFYPTGVPATHVELSKNSRAAFSSLLDAMKAIDLV